MALRQSPRAPRIRSRCVVMQEREWQCEPAWFGALKAGAAKHDIAMILQDVCVNSVPEQFDRAFVAIGREHARTAELEELKIVVARDQRADVELAGRVKSAILFGQRLAQQPVGADHSRAIRCAAVAGGMIDNK